MESGLYAGTVVHQRLRPAQHRLRYRVFSLLLDLDELPRLARRLRLFSLNRFNLFSLHEQDYGNGAGTGLRAYVEQQLAAAGLAPQGAIRLLTMPRILGYAFNPLSVYFCHHAQGGMKAILYEVNNTFGQRHSYLVAVDPGESHADWIHQQCDKHFHVSPFLPLDMRYAFRVQPPRTTQREMRLGIKVADAQGTVLTALFDARRQPLGDAALARAFCSHPLLTLKVVIGIHWEALRLWRKGVHFHRSPPAPAQPVTVAHSEKQDP